MRLYFNGGHQGHALTSTTHSPSPYQAAKATETQEAIRGTSEKYRPVANRTSLLFFLMGDLVKIHTYYIYSLAAFTKVPTPVLNER